MIYCSATTPLPPPAPELLPHRQSQISKGVRRPLAMASAPFPVIWVDVRLTVGGAYSCSGEGSAPAFSDPAVMETPVAIADLSADNSPVLIGYPWPHPVAMTGTVRISTPKTRLRTLNSGVQREGKIRTGTVMRCKFPVRALARRGVDDHRAIRRFSMRKGSAIGGGRPLRAVRCAVSVPACEVVGPSGLQAGPLRGGTSVRTQVRAENPRPAGGRGRLGGRRTRSPWRAASEASWIPAFSLA
jgi:hypothetical protein